MTSDALGVAVWGIGRHATRKILPAIAASPQVALRGVTSRSPAGAEAARAYRCTAWADPADMLADPSVDVVYVATPTGLHHDHGLHVLAAGKHLWCEKALSLDAEALVAVGRERDSAVCEGFMYAFHPQLVRARELFATLGALAGVTCRFGIPHQDRAGYRYRAELGGGALLDVGCYVAHAALLLLGPLAIDWCDIVRPPDFEVDIRGEAIARGPTGVRAHLAWGYGLAYRNELFAWGDRGALRADRIFGKPADAASVLEVTDATGRVERIDIAPADAFVTMLASFAAAVHDRDLRERYRRDCVDQAATLRALIAASPAASTR